MRRRRRGRVRRRRRREQEPDSSDFYARKKVKYLMGEKKTNNTDKIKQTLNRLKYHFKKQQRSL